MTPQFFDCGMQPYDREVDKEFFINNSGKVDTGAAVVCCTRAAKEHHGQSSDAGALGWHFVHFYPSTCCGVKQDEQHQ